MENRAESSVVCSGSDQLLIISHYGCWMQTGYYLPLDRNPENVKMPVVKLPINGAYHETVLQLCGITGYDSPAVL